MPMVLFVCVENAGRSKMAEAIFNQIAEERGLPWKAGSAGTQPASRVNPVVVKAMKEAGVEISARKPMLLTKAVIERATRIITMGCLAKDVCPVVFLEKTEDWGIEDPKGKPTGKVREIRDAIRKKVEGLLDEMQ